MSAHSLRDHAGGLVDTFSLHRTFNVGLSHFILLKKNVFTSIFKGERERER